MKKIIYIIFILIFSLTISSCDQLDALPTIVSLEQNIEEIINSKGENYDFLKDELYIKKMNELAENFIDKDIIEADDFVIGNLDEDNIPEVVVFRQRKVDNTDDPGYLEVYKFDSKNYILLDSVKMNYDINNYDLKIGKISHHQNGIYLNNKVGKGLGLTYGFILRDGKLTSIINDKKLNLISIEPINEIKDIDKDGVLEFSIYTIDPESNEKEIKDKDKLLLWYKWDEKDSADLIKMEKIKVSNNEDLNSDKKVLDTSTKFLKYNDNTFISYLKENLDHLSTKDTNKLLKNYISNLESKKTTNSLKLKGLYEEYKLPLNKINNIEYLRLEDVLPLDKDVKKDIIEKLISGYKIELRDKDYEYQVNYDMFLKEFGENINNQYKDYLKIIKLEKSTDLNLNKFAQKIVMMESFITTYPYSDFLDSIKENLNLNINEFMEMISENPITQEEKEFIEENYKHTYLYEKIENSIDKLNEK